MLQFSYKNKPLGENRVTVHFTAPPFSERLDTFNRQLDALRRYDRPVINVRRKFVLDDTLPFIRKWILDENALRSTPYVRFAFELGLDEGGPRRYYSYLG